MILHYARLASLPRVPRDKDNAEQYYAARMKETVLLIYSL